MLHSSWSSMCSSNSCFFFFFTDPATTEIYTLSLHDALPIYAAPDGYTLSIGHWSTHVVNGAIYSLPYDVFNDFEPISLIASNPQLVVTKLGVPATDMTELIAWAKANQDKLSVGTAGAGSASHVSGVYFQNTLGARF